MTSQGVGTTVEGFKKGVADGSIVGHVGFPESIKMIADTLGWKLDKVEESREPIVTKVQRETPYIKVEPGMVAGCKQIGRGIIDGEERILLVHPQQIHPHLEGVKTGDFIKVEGTPPIDLRIEPEIAGGIGTIALMVNMIPAVINAEPGVVTMDVLPMPAALLGDVSAKVK